MVILQLAKDIDLEGIIYAPKGVVTISRKSVRLNRIIIAEKILVTVEEIEVRNDLDLTCFDKE